MKLFILLIAYFGIFMTPTQAQWQRCVGRPWIATCTLPPHLGNRGCAPRVMWYYDPVSRTCRQMLWRGCGGNTNRWCNKYECELWCKRYPVG